MKFISIHQSLAWTFAFRIIASIFFLVKLLINWVSWQAYINLQTQAAKKIGNSKNASAFLKASTTVHTVQNSEKEVYVAHINSYLRDDPFLKQFLPIDPSTNQLFDLVKDGVLLWYLIRVCCCTLLCHDVETQLVFGSFAYFYNYILLWFLLQ